MGCFLHLQKWDVTDYLPKPLAREGLSFYIISSPLLKRTSPGKRACTAGRSDIRKKHRARCSAGAWACTESELPAEKSAGGVRLGGPKRRYPEAVTVSWRGGRLEEVREGIQSSRGWGSKQHCERRVQGVVKWASTCHIRRQTNEQNKKGARQALPKKGLSWCFKVKNAAVFPTKNPSRKGVLNALNYTDQKAELNIQVFLQCFRGILDHILV